MPETEMESPPKVPAHHGEMVPRGSGGSYYRRELLRQATSKIQVWLNQIRKFSHGRGIGNAIPRSTGQSGTKGRFTHAASLADAVKHLVESINSVHFIIEYLPHAVCLSWTLGYSNVRQSNRHPYETSHKM